MTPYLGRGGPHVIISATSVTKAAYAWEPRFMQDHPDVFVPITEVQHHPSGDERRVLYTMPRMVEPDVYRDLETALTHGVDKLQLLWKRRADVKTDWRKKLHLHLQTVIVNNSINVPYGKVAGIVSRLPDLSPRVIHGDPTFANILLDEKREWWWIDPLEREYIPNEPHVDLGKLFQSCFEYELVLLGKQAPVFRHMLSFDLADRAGLDWQIGMLWCLVHMVRLIPYQESAVRPIFESIVNDMRI